MGSLAFTSSKYTQQKGFFADDARRDPRAVPESVSAAVRRRRPGQGGARLHPHAVRAQRAGVGSRGDPGRADPGRRRLRRAARRLPRRPARAVRRARHPADLRRSAVGHRPHRPHVRLRALGRAARHHDAGQGPGFGPADRRDGREEAPDVAVEARRARQHLRRQSDRLRGGERDDRPGRRRHGRQRGQRRRAFHGAAARTGARLPVHRRGPRQGADDRHGADRNRCRAHAGARAVRRVDHPRLPQRPAAAVVRREHGALHAAAERDARRSRRRRWRCCASASTKRSPGPDRMRDRRCGRAARWSLRRLALAAGVAAAAGANRCSSRSTCRTAITGASCTCRS